MDSTIQYAANGKDQDENKGLSGQEIDNLINNGNLTGDNGAKKKTPKKQWKDNGTFRANWLKCMRGKAGTMWSGKSLKRMRVDTTI